MDRNFSIKIISLISIFLISFLFLGFVSALPNNIKDLKGTYTVWGVEGLGLYIYDSFSYHYIDTSNGSLEGAPNGLSERINAGQLIDGKYVGGDEDNAFKDKPFILNKIKELRAFLETAPPQKVESILPIQNQESLDQDLDSVTVYSNLKEVPNGQVYGNTNSGVLYLASGGTFYYIQISTGNLAKITDQLTLTAISELHKNYKAGIINNGVYNVSNEDYIYSEYQTLLKSIKTLKINFGNVPVVESLSSKPQTSLSFDYKYLIPGKAELLYYINDTSIVDLSIWFMGEFSSNYNSYNIQNVSVIAQGDKEGIRDTLYYMWPESKFNDLKGNQKKLSQTSMSPLVKTILDQTGRLAFYYKEGGEIKSNKKEIKDFLFNSANITNKYGAYFSILVTDKDSLGKYNSNLVGKYVVLVVDKDLLSDDIYYYIINDYNPEEESSSKEALLNDVSNISDFVKENFCNNLGKMYKLPYLNFSYNSKDIDCSVYSITGHFCDAEQLAKHIEKNVPRTYNESNLNSKILNLDYSDFKFGTVNKKYLAKDKIPLALSLGFISPDFNVDFYKDNIFAVINGACPAAFNNKAHYLQNIDKCYIPYNNALYLDLQGFTYNFEYLIPYKEKINNSVSVNYGFDALFNILLALGEDPRNYGLDLVYLKPDNYKQSSGILGASENISELSLRVFDKDYSSKTGETNVLKSPDSYFITVSNLTNNNISGTIQYISRTAVSENKDFFISHLIFNSVGVYLTFNPSYGVNKDLANTSINVFKEKPSLLFTVSPNPKYNFKFENDSGKINISHSEGKFNFNLPKDTPKDTFYLESMLPGLNKKDIYCYDYLDDGSIEGQKYDSKELSEYAINIDLEVDKLLAEMDVEKAVAESSTVQEGDAA